MSAPTLSLVFQFGLGLVVGATVGFVHFRALWWNARLFVRPGSMLGAFAVQLGRFALLVAFFVGLAMVGAIALLAGVLGLLVARHVVVKRFGAVG